MIQIVCPLALVLMRWVLEFVFLEVVRLLLSFGRMNRNDPPHRLTTHDIKAVNHHSSPEPAAVKEVEGLNVDPDSSGHAIRDR